MTFWRSVKIYALSVPIVLAASLIGVLLLTAVFCIPIDPEKYVDSWNVSDAEGWYPDTLEASLSLDKYFNSLRPSIGSAANDRQMFEIAAGVEGASALDQAMKMYKDGEPYDRYWHGYVAVLRPLMRFLHYREIRFLNFILQMGLMFLAIYAVTSRLGKRYGLLLFSQYILLMPSTIGMYICISAGYYIAMIGTVLLLYCGKHFEKREKYLLLFLTIGMCSGYFEQLSYNLITWGMPALWGLLVYGEKKSSKDNTVRLIESGIMWGIGYLGIWAMKLVWLSVYKGTNAFREASGVADMWAGGSILETFVSRFRAHYINWEHYAYLLYAALLFIWLVYMVYRYFSCDPVRDSRQLSLVFIVMASIGWYFVMYNHTIRHHFVTYRIFNTAIGAMIAFWLVSFSGKAVINTGTVLKRSVAFILVGSLALIFAMQLTEESRDTNSNVPDGIYAAVPENNDVRLTFTPPGNRVLDIGFGVILPEGTVTFLVKVYDGGTEVAETTVYSDELSDTGFMIHDVEWNLHRGRAYEMVIGVPEGSSILLLPSADNTISSFTELRIGGDMQQAQLISWIDYIGRPGTRYIVMFVYAFALLIGTAMILVMQLIGKDAHSKVK